MKIFVKAILIILIFINILSCLNYKSRNNNSKEIIENYIVNEILGNRKYPKEYLDNANGVYQIYGVPLKEEIINIKPYSFEGGNVISIRKIIYRDLIHYYYIFDNGKQLYANVEINEPLERLETINIGDTLNRLIYVFGKNYYENDNRISYYGLNQEVVFHIENNIIVKIFIKYILI